MKNIERLAIEATIYDSSAPLENKNDMLVALRQEGSELAALKTDFDLAEQSIRDLTDACRKQEATIKNLRSALKQLESAATAAEIVHRYNAYPALRDALEAAICHIERMNETATDQAMTPESELTVMRAALEAAKGK